MELGEVDDLAEGVCWGKPETHVSVGRMERRLSPGVWRVETMYASHSGTATLPIPPLLARDKRLVLARHGAKGHFEGRTFQAARRAKRTTASLAAVRSERVGADRASVVESVGVEPRRHENDVGCTDASST
jgi:hypothetical protein